MSNQGDNRYPPGPPPGYGQPPPAQGQVPYGHAPQPGYPPQQQAPNTMPMGPGGHPQYPPTQQQGYPQPPQQGYPPPQQQPYPGPYGAPPPQYGAPQQQYGAPPQYPPMGYPQQPMNIIVQNQVNPYGAQLLPPHERKDKNTAVLLAFLAFFIGICGMHRFYLRDTGMGILYFLTGGLCGIGQIIDAIQLASMSQQAFDMKYNLALPR